MKKIKIKANSNDPKFTKRIYRQIVNYKQNNGYDSGLSNVLEVTVKNLKRVTAKGSVTLEERCYLSFDRHGILIFHINQNKGVTDVSIINKVHIDKIKIGHLLGLNVIIVLKDKVLSKFNKKLRIKIIVPSDKNSLLARNSRNLVMILNDEHYVFDK